MRLQGECRTWWHRFSGQVCCLFVCYISLALFLHLHLGRLFSVPPATRVAPATRAAAVRCLVCGTAKVLSLRNNGISACLVGGSSDLRTEEKAIAGEFPLVFVTPEKASLAWVFPPGAGG